MKKKKVQTNVKLPKNWGKIIIPDPICEDCQVEMVERIETYPDAHQFKIIYICPKCGDVMG